VLLVGQWRGEQVGIRSCPCPPVECPLTTQLSITDVVSVPEEQPFLADDIERFDL